MSVYIRHVILGLDGVYILALPQTYQRVSISTISATGTVFVRFDAGSARFPVPKGVTIAGLVRYGSIAMVDVQGTANDAVDFIFEFEDKPAR